MKYLKIEKNKGFYWNGKKYQDIDKIDKDDLLRLLDSAEAEDFEIDIYNKNNLGNKDHQIIYENISNKLLQFLDDKDHFKREVDRLYIEAINKYSVKTTTEDIDDSEDSGGEGQ